MVPPLGLLNAFPVHPVPPFENVLSFWTSQVKPLQHQFSSELPPALAAQLILDRPGRQTKHNLDSPRSVDPEMRQTNYSPTHTEQ